MVSIIIPVYRVESYIAECVNSAVGQTYDNIEIILVDDCGGDKSMELSESILVQSSRSWKICKHEYNRGLSAARNTGVCNASGKYIYFLDSDDYIAPECISIMVAAAEKYRVPVVIGCGFVLLMPDGSICPPWKDNSPDLLHADPLQAYLKKDYNYMACHRLMDLGAYRKCGVSFREGLLHEDVIWSLQMARTGLAMCSALGNKLYYYRQRPGAITSENACSPARLAAHIEIMRMYYRCLLDDNMLENPLFRASFAELFKEAVSRILSRRQLSMRVRSRELARVLKEFNYVIPEVRELYSRMQCFVSLAQYMPALLAFRISSLVR